VSRLAASGARLVAALVCAAAAARAQPSGHAALVPRPSERPLHARLAISDAAAAATVGEVATGRVELREGRAVFGAVAPEFALKRAPSQPCPITAGDRVLLLLRGARSPYVSADEPGEIRILRGAEQEARWTAALAAARSARRDPARLRELYVAWLDEGDDSLRRSALVALGDPRADFPPLPQPILERMAREAVAPGSAPETRMAAALSLAASGPGLAALLEALPGGTDGGDADVFELALRQALPRDPDAAARAVGRGLAHPAAPLRLAALRFGGLSAQRSGLRAAIARVADADADPEVREAARRLLDALAGG
jgi:hypothetical protein